MKYTVCSIFLHTFILPVCHRCTRCLPSFVWNLICRETEVMVCKQCHCNPRDVFNWLFLVREVSKGSSVWHNAFLCIWSFPLSFLSPTPPPIQKTSSYGCLLLIDSCVWCKSHGVNQRTKPVSNYLDKLCLDLQLLKDKNDMMDLC